MNLTDLNLNYKIWEKIVEAYKKNELNVYSLLHIYVYSDKDKEMLDNELRFRYSFEYPKGRGMYRDDLMGGETIAKLGSKLDLEGFFEVLMK